jgi:hypothetical protein
MNLESLLEALVRHRRYHLLGTAFQAVVNFNSKLAMIDAVAQRMLRGRQLSRWDALCKKIDKRSKKRNAIAHFTIVLHGRTAPLQARLHPYWAISRPTPKNEGLKVTDIEGRRDQFTALWGEISAFERALPKRLRRS